MTEAIEEPTHGVVGASQRRVSSLKKVAGLGGGAAAEPGRRSPKRGLTFRGKALLARRGGEYCASYRRP